MDCKQLDPYLLIFAALALLLMPLRWLMAMALAAFVHELGHYVALRLCGVEVRDVRIGISGIRMSVGTMSGWQEIICSLAGPLAGLSLLIAGRWLPRTAVCACFHSAYNLLTVYPLDGGRAIRATGLRESVCNWIEWICLGAVLGAGIYGSLIKNLGVVPLLMAVVTIHRAIWGKRLEKRRGFRYNRERIYK